MVWAWRHTSDGLAPCWVAGKLQPHSQVKNWRGLWPSAVCKGAFYYPIAVKPGCRWTHTGTQEWLLCSAVWAILISGKFLNTVLRLLQEASRMVWKISVINPAIKDLAPGSVSYETTSPRQNLLAGHRTFSKREAVKCKNMRAVEKYLVCLKWMGHYCWTQSSWTVFYSMSILDTNKPFISKTVLLTSCKHG